MEAKRIIVSTPASHGSQRNRPRLRVIGPLLLLVLMIQGCQSSESSLSGPEDTVIHIGVEPATQELIEGVLATYEASHTLSSTILVLASPEDTTTTVEHGEVDCAFILGGTALETLFSVPVGEDSLSVIVPASSLINRISSHTLMEVLTGSITNWAEVGGANEEIVVISPSRGSSIHRTVTTQLMAVSDFSATALVASNDSDSVRLVSQTAGSIAIVRSGSVTSGVRSLDIEDDPSNGRGLFAESITFVALQEPVGELRQLLDWMLSPAGQQVIRNFVDTPTN